MATKLSAGKNVDRDITTPLESKGFEEGFTVRMTTEGLKLKTHRGRWSKALFVPWIDVLDAATLKQAQEAQAARDAKLAAREAARAAKAGAPSPEGSN